MLMDLKNWTRAMIHASGKLIIQFNNIEEVLSFMNRIHRRINPLNTLINERVSRITQESSSLRTLTKPLSTLCKVDLNELLRNPSLRSLGYWKNLKRSLHYLGLLQTEIYSNQKNFTTEEEIGVNSIVYLLIYKRLQCLWIEGPRVRFRMLTLISEAISNKNGNLETQKG